MNQQKIGEFIATCRKEKQLTQQELANRLHITDKAVSKWENGRCLPDISFLEPLATILEVDLVELVRGERLQIKSNETITGVVEELVDITTENNERKRKKLNNWIRGGLVCYGIYAMELQFHFFNVIESVNIQEFLRGLLMGATLYCYLMGYLENNRSINKVKAMKKKIKSHLSIS